MPLGDILPEIVLVLTAIAILLFASFAERSLQWCGAPIALVGLAVAIILCLLQFSQPARVTFSGVWAIDGASIWARMMILATTCIVVALTPDWLQGDRRHGEFYAVLLLSCIGAIMMAGAADLMQLAVGILLSSVTGYTLAAYHRDWAISLEAGMKFFLVGALANTFLLLGIAFIFGQFGGTDYSILRHALDGADPSGVLMMSAALVVLGISFKLAAFPVHVWLPDVAEGAPAPAAAFLTVAPKLGAAVALIRFLDLFLPDPESLRLLIATISVLTMTIGNLAALWQEDVRRLIGWSSVSQSGYVLVVIAMTGLAVDVVPTLLIFLLGYMTANLAAFSAIVHLRGRTKLEHYRGLGASKPWVAATIAVSLLSLTGIPPLVGFIGKLMMFKVVVDGGYIWLAIIAAANTVISLFYYLRVIGPMYLSEPNGSSALLGRWSGASLLVTFLSVPVLGLAGGKLWQLMEGVKLMP